MTWIDHQDCGQWFWTMTALPSLSALTCLFEVEQFLSILTRCYLFRANMCEQCGKLWERKEIWKSLPAHEYSDLGHKMLPFPVRWIYSGPPFKLKELPFSKCALSNGLKRDQNVKAWICGFVLKCLTDFISHLENKFMFPVRLTGQ